MLRCINDGIKTIKPGHQTTGNTTHCQIRCIILHAVPCNLECLIPAMKEGGGSVMVCIAILWYTIGSIITLNAQITARECMKRLSNHVPPMIQTLVPNNGTVQDKNFPIHTDATVQSWFEEHEG
jgi:hypothetical protein